MNRMFDIVCKLAGILGFLLSGFNLAMVIWQNRKRLRIRFGAAGISSLPNHTDLYQIAYSIENQSRLPISITRIQIQVAGKMYDCERLPYVIETSEYRVGGEVVDRTLVKSTVLPINLLALAAESGFLAFSIPQGTQSANDKDLIVQIYTNRGKVARMTLSRHEDTLIS